MAPFGHCHHLHDNRDCERQGVCSYGVQRFDQAGSSYTRDCEEIPQQPFRSGGTHCHIRLESGWGTRQRWLECRDI